MAAYPAKVPTRVLAVKDPVTLISPPTFKVPPTPTPPITCKAPVVVDIDGVFLGTYTS